LEFFRRQGSAAYWTGREGSFFLVFGIERTLLL